MTAPLFACSVALLFFLTPSSCAEWEEAPFMDSPPFDLHSTHSMGFVLRGKAYIATGNLRVEEFDYCGECETYEQFSDIYYSYSPSEGWTDLGPHPAGERGYAIGDIMDKGTDEEVLYFGLGQTRYPDPDNPGSFLGTPRWAFDVNGSYELNPEASTYPRLQDFWKFDGTDWTQLASFPGIGRTHPAMVAVGGKVYAGLGFGELCPTDEYDCEPHSGLEDVRGRSGNLQDVFMYDVATDTWTEIASYPYRVHHPFQFGIEDNGVYNGGAYFLHGHDGGYLYNGTYRYDLVLEEWVMMATLPGPGRVAGSQFSHGNYGYMIGGEIADGSRGDDNLLDGHDNVDIEGYPDTVVKEHHRSMDTCEFWRYDGAEDEWTEMPPAPERSRYAPTTFVLDEYVYLVQGRIREGHQGNYTEIWPEKGYRFYLGDESEESGARQLSVVLCVLVTILCFILMSTR